MNARMFPNSGRMFKALENLDFFVDTDLFMTDAAKYADIVLPACSSFERGEFKPYPGGHGLVHQPRSSSPWARPRATPTSSPSWPATWICPMSS